MESTGSEHSPDCNEGVTIRAALHAEFEDRLLGFQERYQEIARLFEWKCTQKDLSKMLEKSHYHNQVEPGKVLVCA